MERLMKTLAHFAATLAIACGVLAVSSSRAYAHDEFRFVGSIVKIDSAKNLVSVKYKEFDGKEDTVVVKLIAKTTVTRDNKAVPRTQLRAGVHVVVDALGCEDEYEAVAIKIVPAPR